MIKTSCVRGPAPVLNRWSPLTVPTEPTRPNTSLHTVTGSSILTRFQGLMKVFVFEGNIIIFTALHCYRKRPDNVPLTIIQFKLISLKSAGQYWPLLAITAERFTRPIVEESLHFQMKTFFRCYSVSIRVCF